MSHRRPVVAAAVGLLAAGAAVASGTAVATPRAPSGPDASTARGDVRVTQRLAQSAGLQVAAKHAARPTVRVNGRSFAAPNPYLAEVPAGTRVDWSYWRRHLAAKSASRLRAPARADTVPTPYTYTEHEAAGRLGLNDTQATSEHLTALGVERPSQAVRLSGNLSAPSVSYHSLKTREDQGSIGRATHTHLTTKRLGVRFSSRIGDGPHGKARDGHGDFDFYRVRTRAGDTLRATTRGSRLDTVMALYDAKGTVVAANDDESDETVSSAISYRVPRAGYYYVLVAGFSPDGGLPANPFRSGSGSRSGDEGKYKLQITGGPVDRDYYGVRLEPGDVLGGSLTGSSATVQVHRTDGHAMVGSQEDASANYPPQSPLPGGGSAFAYVAAQAGWYGVSVADAKGPYRLLMETYPPGSERTRTGAVQTVFLDFDGERLNTSIFGGSGVSTLSPLRSFLTRWGLTAADEDAVIDATLASVKRDLRTELQEQGINSRLQVRLPNSRDDEDTFGEPDVSRVVIGGTIAQSGVPTIGIAQSVDPGNYAHAESAMVLLDEVSLPQGADDSFNTYMNSHSDRVAFIGRALGNLVAHETGHLVGSFHTDPRDREVNLMDQGGVNFDKVFGVGKDGVGGTADDVLVNFGTDTFSPDEGFVGDEDTLNNTAWAFLPGLGGS